MLRLSKIVILVASLFAANEASAREHEISYGASIRWISSSGYDAVSTTDELPSVEVGLATRVGSLPILGNVWIAGQFSAGSTNAQSFQQFDAELSMKTWQLGIRGTRDLRRWLRTYVRGDLGVTMADLTLSSPSGGRPIADDAEALTAYVGAGVDLALLRAKASFRNPDLALALRVEAGWHASAPLSFRATPDYPNDGTQHIDTHAASLGSIETSGFTLRMAVTGRF